MVDKISRRSFIKKSASAFVGASVATGIGCNGSPEQEFCDLSVVKGKAPFDRKKDPFKLTMKAVDLLGGMEKFVKAGKKVCILPNAQKNNPGVFTNPEVVRAVVKMCKQAGAKEVNCLSWLKMQSWESTGLAKVLKEEGANLKLVDMKSEGLYKKVPVDKGVKLKEALIMKAFYDNDVFITIPICKDHAGNRFTGTLKNMMGLNMQASNMFFHTGRFKNDDIEHLDQCIADLNTILKPDLCIVDATRFIITKGPFGPGKLHEPRKVVAGTDRVAIDAYCATLWDLNPEEIIMIDKANKHKLGEIDFRKKMIREVEI